MVLVLKVNNTQKKNRWKMILIFAMSVIPFILAWWLAGNKALIKGKINYGDLIIPIVTTERNDLIGMDKFSVDNMNELPGHWVLVNIIPDLECNAVCLDAIHKTKQIRLMMNKDLTRIRRAVIMMQQLPPETLDSWLQDDKVLLKAAPSENLKNKLIAVRHGDIRAGVLLIMDPLGNLMMQYDSGFDPYKVKKDLTHLLKTSQIG